jgi:hypothetical protein
MTSESISITYTPENGREHVAAIDADVDVAATELSPKIVHGRFATPIEDSIIQFQLETSPVLVGFRGKKYRFLHLDTDGQFTLQATYERTTN